MFRRVSAISARSPVLCVRTSVVCVRVYVRRRAFLVSTCKSLARVEQIQTTTSEQSSERVELLSIMET